MEAHCGRAEVAQPLDALNALPGNAELPVLAVLVLDKLWHELAHQLLDCLAQVRLEAQP